MIIRNKPAYCIVRLYNRFIIFNCYGHFSKQNFEFLSFSSDCYLCNVTTYLTSSSSFSLSLSLSWIDSDSCQIGAGLKSIYSLCLSFPTVIVLALARTHFSLSLSLSFYHKSLYFIRTMFDHANRSQTSNLSVRIRYGGSRWTDRQIEKQLND